MRWQGPLTRAERSMSLGENFPEHLYNALKWCRNSTDQENQEWCHEKINPAYSDWNTALKHGN